MYDRLADRFGSKNVFLDIDSIAPGTDFTTAIDESLATCGLLIALIGPRCLEIRDAAGMRRLDDPNDPVVLEIGSALRKRIQVIPVLVDGADPPDSAELPESLKALANRNAVPLDHATFRPDSAALVTIAAEIVPTRDSQLASDLADQARDNLGRGKNAMAHQFALEGLKIDRENVTCYLIQALASHALGKHGEAASAIRLAFEGADDKEIRAAAVKIAIEGQPPDLALAWHYDPDNAEITARDLKQLSQTIGSPIG